MYRGAMEPNRTSGWCPGGGVDLQMMIKAIQELEKYDTKKRKSGNLNKFAKAIVMKATTNIQKS